MALTPDSQDWCARGDDRDYAVSRRAFFVARDAPVGNWHCRPGTCRSPRCTIPFKALHRAFGGLPAQRAGTRSGREPGTRFRPAQALGRGGSCKLPTLVCAGGEGRTPRRAFLYTCSQRRGGQAKRAAHVPTRSGARGCRVYPTTFVQAGGWDALPRAWESSSEQRLWTRHRRRLLLRRGVITGRKPGRGRVRHRRGTNEDAGSTRPRTEPTRRPCALHHCGSLLLLPPSGRPRPRGHRSIGTRKAPSSPATTLKIVATDES